MHYRIIPLVPLLCMGDQGVMTFHIGAGRFLPMPFVSWYIQGAEQNILVDTAIDEQDYLNFHPTFRETRIDNALGFEQALRNVGLSPDKIDLIIHTHLHFDHCYNTRRCSNAKVIVQAKEMEFARDPGPCAGLYRPELLEGLDVEVVDGDQQLADGIELWHVPGHSPGCQAVAVQTEKGLAVITGCCTIQENYHPRKTHPLVGDPVILPGLFVDAEQAWKSLLRIRDNADIILPLHDPSIVNQKAIP